MLACTGVFGTVAYTVSRRVREIGIRVALGAAHEDVLRLIVRQGMRPVVIGMAIGLAGAAAVSTVLVSMLFGLSPHDPASFVLIPAALFAHRARRVLRPGAAGARGSSRRRRSDRVARRSVFVV